MVGLAQPGQKVIVGSTVIDWMAIFPLKGAGGEYKMHIFGNLPPDLEGTNGFEFKLGYNNNILAHIH